MWNTRTLLKACGFTTFGLVGVSLMIFEEIQGRIRKSTCYIDAFKYLSENDKVKKYFGAPLKAGYATNIEEPGTDSDSILWYKVPLRGPDGKGALYYKVVKEEFWELSKVEVELERIPDKKLVIMEQTTETDVEFASTKNSESIEKDENSILKEKEESFQ